MSSLTSVHLSKLSSYVADSRTWSLSSSSLFSIKKKFLALSNLLNPIPFFLAKFLWKLKAHSKVKVFAWLEAHKKVNTKYMTRLRRPYKFLNLIGASYAWEVEN